MTQILQDFLSKLNQAPQANHTYIALDDSSSVTADQYNMIKIFVKSLSNLIFSLKPSFGRPSIIKYDDAPIDVILNPTQIGQIETAMNNLVQRKGVVNFVNFVARIDQLATQVQGNKSLFLFTSGAAIDKSKILELEGKGIEVFCFLVLENGQAKKNELDAIFVSQKIVLIPNLQVGQKLFTELAIKSSDIPSISLRNTSRTTATLNISGINDYQDAKFIIRNIKNGEHVRSFDQTLKNSREITLNLNSEDPKFRITVQGFKRNQVSQVSNELELTLANKIHPITQKIQNPTYLQEARNRILEVQVPECLSSVGIETLNIGLLGDMGNGKSSLVNTFCTAIKPMDDEEIDFPATVGNDQKTITKGKESFPITESISVFDAAGLQPNDNSYAEIDFLAQGRLLNHFQQGGVLSEDNKRFQREANLAIAPHVFIYVVDTETALDDDSIRRFGDLLRLLRSHRVQVLVALTKLDKLQENNNRVLDESEFGQALENGVVKKFIQDYANKANIPVNDIFPIFNYTGSNEARSEIKDALGLVLLEKAIHAINIYFKRFTVVKIIDQNERNQGSFLLKNPDMPLEEFYSDFREKISRENRFIMKGFYKNDDVIHNSRWKTMVLNDIKVRKETTHDGFKTWTLKLQNEIAAAAPTPLEG